MRRNISPELKELLDKIYRHIRVGEKEKIDFNVNELSDEDLGIIEMKMYEYLLSTVMTLGALLSTCFSKKKDIEEIKRTVEILEKCTEEMERRKNGKDDTLDVLNSG